MKKLLIIPLLSILCGCATMPAGLVADKSISIGMTQEQIYRKFSSPENWHRQIIDGKVCETWNVQRVTFDFIDNVLVGYSMHGRYYSKDGTEDVRNYK